MTYKTGRDRTATKATNQQQQQSDDKTSTAATLLWTCPTAALRATSQRLRTCTSRIRPRPSCSQGMPQQFVVAACLRHLRLQTHLSRDLPREVQYALGRRGLASINVRNDPYVSDSLHFFRRQGRRPGTLSVAFSKVSRIPTGAQCPSNCTLGIMSSTR